MRPIWVSMPTATTMARPWPAVTMVPDRSILARSPRGVSSSRPSRGDFSTGADSPVMADSSARRRVLSNNRASAGTWSPAWSKITSPTARAAAGRRRSFPFLSARAMGADMSRSCSNAWWAWSSWVMDSTAFTATMMRMMAPSSQSRPPLAARDSPAAASSTNIMGS